MPKTSYSLTTAQKLVPKDTNEAGSKELHKPVACKSKYSLAWASAVSKITAANRFAAAGEERSSRRGTGAPRSRAWRGEVGPRGAERGRRASADLCCTPRPAAGTHPALAIIQSIGRREREGLSLIHI